MSRALRLLVERFPDFVTGVRGLGLLRGLVLSPAGAERGSDIVKVMFERGYLINFAGNEALRFAPPLIVSHDEIDELVGALNEVLGEFFS